MEYSEFVITAMMATKSPGILLMNNFIADIDSYNTGLQTTEYVQAVTDCEMIILSKGAMENLSRTIIAWDCIISKITARALTEKVSRVSVMMPQDAAARYAYFLDKFPNLANKDSASIHCYLYRRG